jgi:galactitol-specific phosphotransferase system IIB component
MFMFNEIKANGTRYYIDKAVLASNEGLNTDTDGVNWYEVDLQPYDENAAPIVGIDLVIPNSGDYVQITKNLDKSKYSHDKNTLHINTVDCLIDGNTLIVPDEKIRENTAVEMKIVFLDGTVAEDIYMSIAELIEELTDLSGELDDIKEVVISGTISK